MSHSNRDGWIVAAAAAVLLAVTMGSRSSFGLFMSPLNTATGLGLATISLAGAINQLLWGAAQPFVGMLADRHGPARIIAAGGVLLALGSALVPFAGSSGSLILAFALIAVANAAAGSNALLLGTVSRHVTAERRGLALGIVAAGGSVGQLILGPATQGLIDASGWVTAMFGLAALSLLALPLAAAFRRRPAPAGERAAKLAGVGVSDALRSPAFWCVAGGFFVCGFHVAFLISHMPGEIRLCGLPASTAGQWIAIVGLCNVIGSIAAGAAIRRGSMRRALIVLYALRAVGVALFISLPKTEFTVLAFAVWMGLTYMATLPPTSGLVAKLFGVQRLATLLGVVMLVHQVGAFLGVWLGGLALQANGSYEWIWRIDIALAVIAAAIHLPLRETVATEAPAARTPAIAIEQAPARA